MENEEIFCIEDDKVNIILKGSAESYDSDDSVNLSTLINGENIFLDNINYNIYLKEYKNYEFFIEILGDYDVSFYHENIHIRNKISKVGKSGRFLSGVINFKGDIGFSDFYIRVNGENYIKITVEVRPSKISYKGDYEAILKDINNEVYNLAYGFLRRTYLGTEINNYKGSLSEFYSILNYILDNCKRAINMIIYSPYQCLVKEDKIVKYHNIKNPGADSFRWLEKKGHLFKDINGKLKPTEALVTNKIVTLDNNENRFLKFILEDIIKSIENFRGTYRGKNNRYMQGKVVDEEVIKNLEKIESYFNGVLNSTFLNSLQSSFIRGDISLVFRMKAGYRDIYKYYLMLKRGLTIKSNLVAISMKELSLLYEYWCFIKINSILKKSYTLVSTDMIKFNRDSITVTLKKGKKSTVTYENPKTGERFTLSYNSFGYSATVKQKPDNILELKRDNIREQSQYIFDAKYKIETGEAYQRGYGGVGPKEEDINTMHRYRDAILYSEENKKNSIAGAFVLFPYDNEEEYREQKFYKTIGEVNIGAIPFLPASTKIMKEFLEGIIDGSALKETNKDIEEFIENKNVIK